MKCPKCQTEVALEEPLRLAVGGRTNPLTISPDGSRIVFAAESRGTSQLFLRQLDDFDFKPIPGTKGARNPFFSPDGKRVGFFAGTKMQTVAFDGGPPRVILESALDDMGSDWGTDGGTEPVWSRDGRELFYRQGDLMMVVDVVLGAEFSAGKPRPLFEGRFDVGVIGNPDYDVTADGQRFLMLKRSEASAPVKLHVVLNWAQALADSFAAER